MLYNMGENAEKNTVEHLHIMVQKKNITSIASKMGGRSSFGGTELLKEGHSDVI